MVCSTDSSRQQMAWETRTPLARSSHAVVRPARLIDALGTATLAVLLLTVVVGQQVHDGAYRVTFNNDEASHYISALLIHDYLRAVARHGVVSPLAYFVGYQGHYPLIGIGHWPPFYYLVIGIWMFAAGWTRASILLLSATVTAATGAVLYRSTAGWLGRPAALAAALAFVLAPLIEAGSCALMLDIPLALVSLLAALAYARFLESGRAAHALLFGAGAAAAMLTKGNGACMGLLPPFVVLLGRRFDLLRRWTFWLPVPIVLILAAPWLLLTYRMTASGFRFQWGLHYARIATFGNAAILTTSFGVPIVLAALCGLVAVTAGCWRAPPESRAESGRSNLRLCIAALFLAVVAFQSVVPADIQARYLAPAAAPVVALAMCGGARVALWAIRRRAGRQIWVGIAVPVVLLLSMLPGIGFSESPLPLGLAAAARAVWTVVPAQNPVVLIAADGETEGAMIGELAMRDPQRPSLFCIRGSRLLGGGGYNNSDYVPRYQTSEAVLGALDSYAIPLVLLRPDARPTAWRHLAQLQDSIARRADRWRQLWRTSGITPTVTLYEVVGNAAKPVDAGRIIALNAPHALGDQSERALPTP
jgi:4-amino-4-deoxy-L-arabinose transferase-like glycosyltransferase